VSHDRALRLRVIVAKAQAQTVCKTR
jgi:hypothetical protein